MVKSPFSPWISLWSSEPPASTRHKWSPQSGARRWGPGYLVGTWIFWFYSWDFCRVNHIIHLYNWGELMTYPHDSVSGMKHQLHHFPKRWIFHSMLMLFVYVYRSDPVSFINCLSGWWLTYPSEK